jgi:predicted RNase H-like nuclease (RuvC/YqgF family)
VRRVGDEAATTEHGGPQGPVDVSWLILQRLSDLKDQIGDLKDQMGDLRRGQQALDAKIESLRAELDGKIESVRRDLDTKIESVRSWSIGLLLLAIVGLLVKLFLPGG